MFDWLPKPQVDCWDYVFDKSGHDIVWYATTKGAPLGSVVSWNTNALWQFLVVADNPEQLVEDLRTTHPDFTENGRSIDDVVPISIPLYALFQYWRMFRYRGRNVVAMECKDYLPSSPYAWPIGPIAPVRNAFVLLAQHRKTQQYHTVLLNETELPVCAPTINELVHTCAKIGIDPDILHESFDIVLVNVLELSLSHPLVYWLDKPFPLLPVVMMNPNHNDDPEEALLAATD